MQKNVYIHFSICLKTWNVKIGVSLATPPPPEESLPRLTWPTRYYQLSSYLWNADPHEICWVLTICFEWFSFPNILDLSLTSENVPTLRASREVRTPLEGEYIEGEAAPPSKRKIHIRTLDIGKLTQNLFSHTFVLLQPTRKTCQGGASVSTGSVGSRWTMEMELLSRRLRWKPFQTG